VAAPACRRVRPAHRQGHLLRRRTQRSRGDARAGRVPHRRRQLGGPGRAALRQPRPPGDAARARRLAREEHVALSVEQIASKSNIAAALHCEVQAAHGEAPPRGHRHRRSPDQA
jgi:hypothetical protein